jgi:hypothetical protein
MEENTDSKSKTYKSYPFYYITVMSVIRSSTPTYCNLICP